MWNDGLSNRKRESTLSDTLVTDRSQAFLPVDSSGHMTGILSHFYTSQCFVRESLCQVNWPFCIFQMSVNCCCTEERWVGVIPFQMERMMLICKSQKVRSLLTDNKSQAPGPTMKVMHRLNTFKVGIQRDNSPHEHQRWRMHAAPFWLIFNRQRYKSRAILSMTDSLYVAPINSYFLTCVERLARL